MDLLQRAIENGFINEPSQAEVEEITKHLKEFKISKHRPVSLEQLAIQCILDNRSQFRVSVLNRVADRTNNNPFEVLSRGPSEKLLSAAIDKKVELKTEKLYLILQLLNGQVTEFDSGRLKPCDKVSSADAMFFRHMLAHCPKIKKAYILPTIWRNFCILPRAKHQDLLSVMASSWPNLSSLCIDTTAGLVAGELMLSGNNTVETICANLPNLSFLKVAFDRHEMLSARDCEMLSKMNNLKSLHLICSDSSDIKLAENVVHAAGRVPFLERFSFTVKKSTLLPMGFQSSSFIVLYSKLYPHKNLLLEKHTLSMNHSGAWPSCLSVEDLVLIGDSQQFDMSSCCNVRSLKTIDKFLSLLKPMGANLNSLSVVSTKGTVDLLPIFSQCPRLKELSIRTGSGTVEDSLLKDIKASQLSQLSNFKFISNKVFPAENCQVSNLYAQYFLTCRNNYETYQVQSVSELRAIVRILREEERSCFDHLKDIQFFCNPRLGDEKDALRVIGMLMLRSPYLKTVAVTSTQYHGLKVPAWLKKVMTDVGVACVPTFQPSESDLWGEFDPYESYDDLSEDDDIDDDDDEEDAIGFSYDSDGNPTFEDIQGYLMWRDSI